MFLDIHDGSHLNLEQLRPVVEDCCNIWMIPPQGFLKYLLRSLVQRFRLVVLALEGERKAPYASGQDQQSVVRKHKCSTPLPGC